jgi:hypothetical protein
VIDAYWRLSISSLDGAMLSITKPAKSWDTLQEWQKMSSHALVLDSFNSVGLRNQAMAEEVNPLSMN